MKQNQDKPLYHVNIPGYSIGGPVMIPKLLDRGKVFFFVSQEFTDDLRPSTVTRANYPTALERQGDFSQTYFGTANGPGQGTLQLIINPDTGLPFPGNKIPKSCAGIPGCMNGYMNPMGQKMLNLLPLPNNIHNPQPDQYNAANSALRKSAAAPPHQHLGAFRRGHQQRDPRQLPVREGPRGQHQQQRFAPGIGYVDNNACRAGSRRSAAHRCSARRWSTKWSVGRANSFGFMSDEGEYKYDYRECWRPNVGVDPPRLEPFGDLPRRPGPRLRPGGRVSVSAA